MAINTVEVLNAVRLTASTLYQERVPLATRTNVQEVGNAITEYSITKEEFLNTLVNRIALVTVSSRMATNILAPFKKGMLEYGQDIEEIFVDMLKASAYDEALAETEMLKRELPNVDVLFHRKDRKYKFKVTINDSNLKSAFLSSGGMSTLISAIVNSMYSGDNYDEYIHMKELFAEYEANFYVVETPKLIDNTTGKQFIRAIKQKVVDVGFMNNLHNKKAKMQISSPDQLVLFVHKDVAPLLDTEVLSSAFNGTKLSLDTQVVVVDDFGSMDDTQAVLVDKDWFVVYDTKFETSSFYNAEGLYTNYWLHHWALMSTSQFHNAIRFTVAPGEMLTPEPV